MAQPRVLADRVIPGEGVLRDILRIAAANVLLALCAQIAVPLPWTPVPVTGQTFGVMLVAVLLGSRRAAIVVVLYLLEGAAGLPVFQPFGAPGIARLMGPTAGYLWAYPFAAFLSGWLVEQYVARVEPGTAARTLRLVAAVAPGEALILTSGFLWYTLLTGLGWKAALAGSVLPFLPFDLLKIALVVAAVRGVELATSK